MSNWNYRHGLFAFKGQTTNPIHFDVGYQLMEALEGSIAIWGFELT